MPITHERTFRIRHYECDAYGHVNNTNYLRYMQEAAFDASAALGYDLARYEALGHHWLVRETEIEYLAPLRYGDSVRVKTWVEDFHRVRSRRAYELNRLSDGERVARGTTDWVYLDSQTGRPARIPPEMVAAYEQIDRNVAACSKAVDGVPLDSQAEADRFVRRVFENVGEIPGYEGFFSAERARALMKPMSRAVSDARSKAPEGREFEAGGRAARRSVLSELGFGFAERIMATLIQRDQLAGFLFVARNGRDLRRLVQMAERLRNARSAPAHRHEISNGADAGRRYGSELVEIADRLAPYGLSLPDGTPTDQLRDNPGRRFELANHWRAPRRPRERRGPTGGRSASSA